jgi:Fur family zinc uptake transcriptional regulator
VKKKLPAQFIGENHDHQNCVSQALSNAEEICQRHHKRFTDLRRKILELVWRQHKPVGAYELLELLQEKGRAAPPTVYRTLDFLQELGLVHRLASLNAYVGCTVPGEPHDGQFLICESCQSLAEMDVSSITNAIEESARESGFSPHRHTIEIMGLCPSCRE